MTTRSNSGAENPNDVQLGKQRKSSIQKVLSNLPHKSKDNFMLMLLFGMGISGFIYILTVPVGNNLNKSSLLEKLFKSTEGKSITANFIKSNFVKVDGNLTANSFIVFSFQNLVDDAKYEVHFGDNTVLPVTSDQIQHTYITSGTYKMELKKISELRTTVVHCEYLNIQ